MEGGGQKQNKEGKKIKIIIDNWRKKKKHITKFLL
jgi:hypothetical protein